MEIHKNGVLCTKKNIWKKKKLIIAVIDYMINAKYEFVELVYGEPKNFTFADEYHEIEKVLKKKGFYGIRIKFKNNDNIVEFHANTNGIQNVKYDVFTASELSFKHVLEDLEKVSSIIGSSNETLVKGGELLYRKRKYTYIAIALVGAIALYFLNVYVFLFRSIASIFSIAPLFTFLLLFYFLRRR